MCAVFGRGAPRRYLRCDAFETRRSAQCPPNSNYRLLFFAKKSDPAAQRSEALTAVPKESAPQASIA
jgi:hypothetical protein